MGLSDEFAIGALSWLPRAIERALNAHRSQRMQAYFGAGSFGGALLMVLVTTAEEPRDTVHYAGGGC